MPWQAQMKGKETGTQRCAQEQRRDREERRKTKDASTTQCVHINTASPASNPDTVTQVTCFALKKTAITKMHHKTCTFQHDDITYAKTWNKCEHETVFEVIGRKTWSLSVLLTNRLNSCREYTGVLWCCCSIAGLGTNANFIRADCQLLWKSYSWRTRRSACRLPGALTHSSPFHVKLWKSSPLFSSQCW